MNKHFYIINIFLISYFGTSIASNHSKPQVNIAGDKKEKPQGLPRPIDPNARPASAAPLSSQAKAIAYEVLIPGAYPVLIQSGLTLPTIHIHVHSGSAASNQPAGGAAGGAASATDRQAAKAEKQATKALYYAALQEAYAHSAASVASQPNAIHATTAAAVASNQHAGGAASGAAFAQHMESFSARMEAYGNQMAAWGAEVAAKAERQAARALHNAAQAQHYAVQQEAHAHSAAASAAASQPSAAASVRTSGVKIEEIEDAYPEDCKTPQGKKSRFCFDKDCSRDGAGNLHKHFSKLD